MLSRLSEEIAISLLKRNRDCYYLTLAELQDLSELPLASKLGRIADRYRQNTEELQVMLRAHRVESAQAFDPEVSPRYHFTANSPEETLEVMTEAATELRREYERGIRATRELSEQLHRQYARVQLTCAELTSQSSRAPRRLKSV